MLTKSCIKSALLTVRINVVLCAIFLVCGVSAQSYDDQMEADFAPMSSLDMYQFLKPISANSSLGTVDKDKECPEPEKHTKCCTDDDICVCCKSNLYSCSKGICLCKNNQPCCTTFYYCRCCEGWG